MKQRRLTLDLDAEAKAAAARPLPQPQKPEPRLPVVYANAMGRPASDQEILQQLAGFGIVGDEALRQLTEMKSCNGNNVYRPIETVPIKPINGVNPTHGQGTQITGLQTVIPNGVLTEKVTMQYINPPPIKPFKDPFKTPEAQAFVEEMMAHGHTHQDTIKRLHDVSTSVLYCEHANECPHQCNCPSYCYCRVNGSCKTRSDKHGKH